MPDPTLTKSQLALLRKIDERAETNNPFTVKKDMPLLSQERTDAITMRNAGLLNAFFLIGDPIHLTHTGNKILAAHDAKPYTETCASDSCDEEFTYDPKEEEYHYCSEECEAEQSARNMGEDAHDRMKEGV